jgi:hypothetical protein
VLRPAWFCNLLAIVFVCAACGDDDDDCSPGALGCACLPRSACDGSLECLSGVCVAPATPDAGRDAGRDAATEPFDECTGRAGAEVCDGARLLRCGRTSDATLLEECASARHCEGGRELGECLTCLEGEHRCDGAELQRCADDGLAFEGSESCASAEVCNAEAGSCMAGCSAGQFACDGAELRGCTDDLTGFATVETCASADLCDASAGECDECVPGEERCSGALFETCDADGQAFTAEDCAASGERCTAAGCVAGCEINEHCGPPTPFCSGGRCVECRGASDCNAMFAVCEAGSCEIGPGCGNGRIDPDEECERGVSPGPGMGTWDVTNCDTTCHRTVYQNCTTAARQMLCMDTDAACLIGRVVGQFCSPNVLSCITDGALCPRAPGYEVNCGPEYALVGCHLACQDDSDCPADLYCYDADFKLCCPSPTHSSDCTSACDSVADCATGESCVKVTPKLCAGRPL